MRMFPGRIGKNLPHFRSSELDTKMSALKDYQRFAVRCLEAARLVVDPGHKAFLVEMAQAWQKLADQAANFKGVQVSTNSDPDRGD